MDLPAERLAFVLHDLFAVPFEEIAPIRDGTIVAIEMIADAGHLDELDLAILPD